MKRGIQFAGIMLLVLALACLYVGAEGFLTIRPAAAYEDMGVHTFSPYQTYPTQVKNTAGGRQGRLHPTKTVYLVYYRATDGSGYQWKDEVQYRNTAEKMVAAGECVERRVLSIRESGKYITVEGDQTAGSYVFHPQRRYGGMVLLSAAYLVVYGCVWVSLIRKRRAAAR